MPATGVPAPLSSLSRRRRCGQFTIGSTHGKAVLEGDGVVVNVLDGEKEGVRELVRERLGVRVAEHSPMAAPWLQPRFDGELTARYSAGYRQRLQFHHLPA
jgi:hypothetical protein